MTNRPVGNVSRLRSDTFRFMFYDDRGDEVNSADIPLLNQQFNVPGSNANWVRVSPDPYTLELDEDHRWMKVITE